MLTTHYATRPLYLCALALVSRQWTEGDTLSARASRHDALAGRAGAYVRHNRFLAIDCEYSAATIESILARYRETGCSQCHATFGPGDTGFSRCADHRRAKRAGLLAPALGTDVRALLGLPSRAQDSIPTK